MITTLTTTTRTLAVWSHGGFCELGRVECGQPATHRLTTGAGDWLVCAECAEGEKGRDDTLELGADECPAGGAHSFVLVPAGIDTGLYMAAWLCDECSAAAPRVEVEYDGPGTGFDEEAGW